MHVPKYCPLNMADSFSSQIGADKDLLINKLIQYKLRHDQRNDCSMHNILRIVSSILLLNKAPYHFPFTLHLD